MLNNMPLLSVIIVLAIILAGLFTYLISIDRRLRKWEKAQKK
jgi:hypothetical protein